MEVAELISLQAFKPHTAEFGTFQHRRNKALSLNAN